MKSEIKFYDQNMEIPVETGKNVYYYGKLMYVIYEAPSCRLFFAESEICTVEVPLKDIMHNLPQCVFFECNRATIINLCYCKGYNVSNRSITMNDGKRFELSRRRVAEFKNMKHIIPRLSPPCPDCYTCIKQDCVNRVIFCR